MSQLSRGHMPNKATAFTRDKLFTYFATAPDVGEHLRTKALALLGFFGCVRSCELVYIKLDDVRDTQQGVWVTLTRAKCPTATARQEILVPRVSGHRVVPADVFLRYRDAILAAPINRGDRCDRLWRRFDAKNGKWMNGPIGKEVIKAAPRLVATFLQLPNAQQYRGHSWRPSGASTLATNGANGAQLRTAGNWQHLSAAENYIRDGAAQRVEIASLLVGPDSQPTDMSPTMAPTVAPKEPQKPQKSQEPQELLLSVLAAMSASW